MERPIWAEQGIAKAIRAMTMSFSLRDWMVRAVIVAMVLHPNPRTSGITAFPVMPELCRDPPRQDGEVGEVADVLQEPEDQEEHGEDREDGGERVEQAEGEQAVRADQEVLPEALRHDEADGAHDRVRDRHREEQREGPGHVDHQDVDQAEKERQDGKAVEGVAAQPRESLGEPGPRRARQRFSASRVAATSSTHWFLLPAISRGAVPARLARTSSTQRRAAVHRGADERRDRSPGGGGRRRGGTRRKKGGAPPSA